ncbi:MAG: M48 family metallopeptidase [Acidimicrobiia bacterium]
MIDNVEVTRSRKRKRTVSARLIGTTLHLAIPAWMSQTEERQWIDEMSRRYMRKRSIDRIDLEARARKLARQYKLTEPRQIKWADNMSSRWGSCTMSEGTVRISSKLAAFPEWVIDYVIVHELAHFDVPDHSPRFWDLVARYPKAERARGFLMAKCDEPDDEPEEAPQQPARGTHNSGDDDDVEVVPPSLHDVLADCDGLDATAAQLSLDSGW